MTGNRKNFRSFFGFSSLDVPLYASRSSGTDFLSELLWLFWERCHGKKIVEIIFSLCYNGFEKNKKAAFGVGKDCLVLLRF